jgi:hypothetical protein
VRTRLHLLVVLAALGTPACAQIVTLHVQDQPLSEVLQSLELQTGWELHITGAVDPLRGQPITLTLDDVPVKQALDAICEQANAHWQRVNADMVWIQEGPDLSQEPEVEVGGFRVRILSIHIADDEDFRSLDGAIQTRNYLRIDFEVEAPTDDAADALFGLHPGPLVVDDTGRVLAPEQTDYMPRQMRPANFPCPDRFQAALSFAQPAPTATALRQIEGELTVYEKPEVLRAEFPWADKEQSVEVEGLTFTLGKPNFTPQPDRTRGYLSFTFRGLPPDPDLFRTAFPQQCRAKLELPSGATIVASSGGGGGGMSGDGTVQGSYQLSFSLPPDSPEPKRVVFEMPLPTGALVGVPYRFANIPLPQRPAR